ncbi:MAG: hypothetical protein IIC60_11965 [Proteobacteria bacterium]|nr:hypothetical protein [Pseudomonadota bacterium]
MKKLLLVVSVIAALVLSQTASADSRHHRRSHHSFGHYSNYNPYHYGFGSHHGGSYFGFSYGHNRHYGHRSSGSFLGGLVLGSLLSYPSYSSRRYDTVSYRSAPVIRSREVVVVNRSITRSTAPIASGRRLLRDLEGNCFERIVDEDGNEIRVQLDASECNF